MAAMAQPRPRHEIAALTSIRGVAALCVLCLHLYLKLITSDLVSNDMPSFLNIGQAAVDVFFLLSGYVLTLSYNSKITYKQFLIRRVTRIFPLHLFILALIVTSVAVLRLSGASLPFLSTFSFATLPFEATLTQNWFGLDTVWNSPAWSISVEFLIYLFFPMLLLALKRMKLPGLSIAVLILFVAQIAIISFGAEFPTRGPFATLRGFAGVATGAAVCLLRPHLPQFKNPWIAVGLILLLNFAGLSTLTVLPAIYIIVALSHPLPTTLNAFMKYKPVVWLGRVSFSIYMVQMPALWAIALLLRRVSWLHAHVNAPVMVVVSLAVVFGTAEITWRFVEVPGVRLGRAWTHPVSSTSQAA